MLPYERIFSEIRENRFFACRKANEKLNFGDSVQSVPDSPWWLTTQFQQWTMLFRRYLTKTSWSNVIWCDYRRFCRWPKLWPTFFCQFQTRAHSNARQIRRVCRRHI